jgi:hypothetical protein
MAKPLAASADANAADAAAASTAAAAAQDAMVAARADALCTLLSMLLPLLGAFDRSRRLQDVSVSGAAERSDALLANCGDASLIALRGRPDLPRVAAALARAWRLSVNDMKLDTKLQAR